MSVTRRWASAPSGSLAGSSGAFTGHQTTTGASGSSSGRTTDCGVVGHLAVQPQHDRLAGARVRAHPHLGVQPGLRTVAG